MCLAAFYCFLHAVVAEFCCIFECARHRFAIHQCAAEGRGEHIARAVQRLRNAGSENFRIFPVQTRTVADLLAAANTGDDNILHGELFKQFIHVRVHRAACKERRLRAVGRDEPGRLAERAHRLHVFLRKAAVERAVVAQHRVDNDQGVLAAKIAQKAFRKSNLLRRGEKAGADAVKFDVEFLPVCGKGLHLVRHVPHDVIAEAACRMCG